MRLRLLIQPKNPSRVCMQAKAELTARQTKQACQGGGGGGGGGGIVPPHQWMPYMARTFGMAVKFT